MFQPDPERPLFKGKRLLYMEESMFHWVHAGGALPYLIPSSATGGGLRELVQGVDGILLSGGIDIAPENYGEAAMSPDWAGDRIRDQYEIDILKCAYDLGRPVLGICRGAQLINVMFGGSLFQDIQTANPKALVHRDWDIYDHNFHMIEILPDTGLSQVYPDIRECKINSVHHQAIDRIGNDLVVEARSTEDGIVEAIRYSGDRYIVGLQWHPEFQDRQDPSLLDPMPVMHEFLTAASASGGSGIR